MAPQYSIIMWWLCIINYYRTLTPNTEVLYVEEFCYLFVHFDVCFWLQLSCTVPPKKVQITEDLLDCRNMRMNLTIGRAF